MFTVHLRYLHKVAKELFIAEFDVTIPAIEETRLPALVSRGRLEGIIEAYGRGMEEYSALALHPGNEKGTEEERKRGVEEGEKVIQGFLCPVLFSQVDEGYERSTHEQSAQSWREDLEAAGFTNIRVYQIWDYWWSAGVLLHASSS